jgi:hypothetical protein
MNTKKVPQLFVATGAAKWADPKHFPWTMGWQPSYQAEARIYAQYIMNRRSTTPGRAIPRSRSATSFPIAAPASAYGIIGKMEEAYFKMINDQGGINGRKINFVSYDDAYSPAKAVEQTRKLVESDEVLFVFGPLGTPSNTAIMKYLNAKKVPQLFVATGATKFGEYKTFHGPWAGSRPIRAKAASSPIRHHREAERQDRRVLPERRPRQGHAEGPQGRPRRQGLDDRGRRQLRSVEPTIDSHIVKLKAGRRHLHLDLDAEIRRAGDQEGRPRSAGSRCSSRAMSAPPSAP